MEEKNNMGLTQRIGYLTIHDWRGAIRHWLVTVSFFGMGLSLLAAIAGVPLLILYLLYRLSLLIWPVLGAIVR